MKRTDFAKIIIISMNELRDLDHEHGASVLTAAGYVEKDTVTSSISGCTDFVTDEYWVLYNENDEPVDVITYAEFFNIIKHNVDDIDDVDIISNSWQRVYNH